LHIFVWIICSRDLRKVTPAELERICLGREQSKYNAIQPYKADAELTVVDLLLGKLQAIRRFALLKLDIPTSRDFPSMYHFRIFEFLDSDESGSLIEAPNKTIGSA
jgi:hypothetical protein